MNLEQLKKSVQVIEACCESQAEFGNDFYDQLSDVQIDISDLKQLIAAANCLPELVAAAKRFKAADSRLETLRITSTGKKLEDAEAEFVEASMSLDSAINRAETI